jgi:signal transduction histidine kinase
MKATKATGELEAGVLSTFRLFIGIQLAITLLGILHWQLIPFPPSPVAVTLALLSTGEAALLFLYLALPALQRWLQSAYLPIAIAFAAAGPIVDPTISLVDFPSAATLTPDIHAQLVLWRQLILLFIPLIIVSWQYSIHKVIFFCIATTLLNIALLSRTMTFSEIFASSLLGILVAQVIIYFLVGHMIVKLMNVQRRQRQRLTEANERLAQYAATLEQLTISRERNRVARELHDVLAHTLSGVAVELEGVRSMQRRDPERADALLNNSLQAVRDGLGETRRALKELRAKPLEDLGLALAVRTLGESYASRSDLHIHLEIDANLGDFSAELQQCLYRIAQEALANVADHAQTQQAKIVLRREEDRLYLLVSDDGCGFASNSASADNRYGLLGMRERAEMIGGCLTVESQPGKGTRISFSYPLKSPRMSQGSVKDEIGEGRQ